MSGGDQLVTLDPRTASSFPIAAEGLLHDSQLRKNVAHATDVIQRKRNALVIEKKDWQQLRSAGEAIRQEALDHLDEYLIQFEQRCTEAGGVVHWAADAAEARQIVLRLLQQAAAKEVIKIKSMTTAEIELNDFLDTNGIKAWETDLAELILQLGHGQPSHIVVPALHKNRQQVREIFSREMNLPDLADDPQALTAAARTYLRERFLRIDAAICGANFLVAENGAVCIVESEGNGRMCLTLPRMLISIAGIEKVIPEFSDLEVLLQVLPRSATGERMNPYNSIWRGVTPGDGPQEFHVVLLDNGRSDMLAKHTLRQTLQCIRCGACQNACPVYRQTGGHAYGSVYAGPIGAILTPQLQHMEYATSLPYASSLCGACYEVCPVKINIPEVLLHLRGEVVEQDGKSLLKSMSQERLGMKVMARVFRSHKRFETVQQLARLGQKPLVGEDHWIHWLPGMAGRWTAARDLEELPGQTFRGWWKDREKAGKSGGASS